MPASKSPAFVKVNYHSEYGAHVAIVPTLAWNAGVAQGDFATHSGSVTPADAMIKALYTALKPILPTLAFFDNYVIYSQPAPEDLPVPVASGDLNFQGTEATPGWDKATQATYTFRTSNFGVMKLVTLDCASNNDFSKVTATGTTGILFDVWTELSDPTNGWAGQDNGRPMTLISQTVTLNEKLRRAYRLA